MLPVNIAIREGSGDEQPTDPLAGQNRVKEAIAVAATQGSAAFGDRVMVHCDMRSAVGERYRVDVDGEDFAGPMRARHVFAVLSSLAGVAAST